MPSRLSNILPPPKFRAALRRFGANRPLRILDVGCGNHSPTLTKGHFPQAIYHGVDIADYNVDAADKAALDHFFLVHPDGSGYDAIPDHSYDFIICNHVVEHMRDPHPIVRQLCCKVAEGGLIRLAFPSERALGLPSAEGTLHYSDDPTHVHVPGVRELCNLMLQEELRILFAGRTRDAARWWLGLAAAGYQCLRGVIGLRRQARGTWFYYGFEDSILAERPLRPRP